MPLPPLRITAAPDALASAFDAIRAELDVEVDFPADVQAEAETVARSGPFIEAADDLREVSFVSIDPPGARDLDQALAIERSRAGGGYVVQYAIADVGAFVRPGGAIDRAARQRGVTVYLPDRRAPLHPTVLSEGAASLLPGAERQALVWRFVLDADGALASTSLRRGRVRNRRAYSYEEAQRLVGSGLADGTVALLAEVGPKLVAREQARGGAALEVPEQIIHVADGEYALEYRAPLPIEQWNAQVSLMTGMAAADVMLGAGVGVLRTLPPPGEEDLAVFRRHARALGIEWPTGMSYGEIIRSLDADVADHLALLAQAGRLFRGAGYVSFGPAGSGGPPEDASHAGVAAPYAHVTAPLRRLVDRFGNEILLAVLDGREPPQWAQQALPELPKLMADARRREGAADARAADLVEAAVLSGCIGATLDAVVVALQRRGAQVQVRRPAVVAHIDAAGVELGDEIRVRVDRADVLERTVELSVVP